MAAAGGHYVFDPDMANKLTNVFDKWVLAYTQTLIVFVREEMAAYRLYTVVPRLVTFINDLANWYCRLNRRRLKGSDGIAEQQQSLDTLYLVLYTICITMAPFTPFFTEYLYQNLRKLQPPSAREDSVHYLPYPEPDKRFFNHDIERSVTRAQAVINLGRQARDRGKTSIKQPLSSLIIFQRDPQYIKDIQSLELYVKEEVNVRELIFKAEDFGDSIQLKPNVNRDRLGPRLKGDRGKVEAAVTALTKEQLLQFQKDGKIVLCGHELTNEDVALSNEFVGATATQQAAWNDDVLIVLNMALDDSLKKEGNMREVCNRIQRLRKAAGLKTTDSGVTVYYVLGGKANANQKAIQEAITFYLTQIEKKTGTSLVAGEPPAGVVRVGNASSKLNGVDVSLWVSKS